MALIKCKECSNEVSNKAKACPKCGAKVPRTSLLTWFLAFLGVMWLIGFAASGGKTTTQSAAPTSVPDEIVLKVENFDCGHEHGYSIIEGRVKNVSNRSLSNVQAVGSFMTKEGVFVKSDSALIEYNPILAGQTSPFKVMTTHNPAMTKCELAFKTFSGGSLGYE